MTLCLWFSSPTYIFVSVLDYLPLSFSISATASVSLCVFLSLSLSLNLWLSVCLSLLSSLVYVSHSATASVPLCVCLSLSLSPSISSSLSLSVFLSLPHSSSVSLSLGWKSALNDHPILMELRTILSRFRHLVRPQTQPADGRPDCFGHRLSTSLTDGEALIRSVVRSDGRQHFFIIHDGSSSRPMHPHPCPQMRGEGENQLPGEDAHVWHDTAKRIQNHLVATFDRKQFSKNESSEPKLVSLTQLYIQRGNFPSLPPFFPSSPPPTPSLSPAPSPSPSSSLSLSVFRTLRPAPVFSHKTQ